MGALLPSSIEFSEKGFKFRSFEEEESEGRIAFVEISKIGHNPYQPRKDFDQTSLEELKNSIIQHGVIQPVTVRRSMAGYEIISGERRLRAAIESGLSKIPAYIMEEVSDIEMLEMALIENVQRENLNPIEIANGYNRLIEECNLTQEVVAKKVGLDRTTITNFIRLLKLPEKIQESLRNKDIMMGHAKAILALESEEKMLTAWKEVSKKSLSVRATESLIKEIDSGKFNDGKGKKKLKKYGVSDKPNVSPDVALVLIDIENKLREVYATQVRINPKNDDSGLIEFNFYSKDDLERLIEMLTSIEQK